MLITPVFYFGVFRITKPPRGRTLTATVSPTSTARVALSNVRPLARRGCVIDHALGGRKLKAIGIDCAVP